jgi:hypothetical protein
MKSTFLLLQTNRFPVEWGDDGDASPPPGREFADALLKRLLQAGARSRLHEVPADWWEHSNWFFSVNWREKTYDLTVEASPNDTAPPTWAVGVSKAHGLFKALFGKADSRYEVNDEFLQEVHDCVMDSAAVNELKWVTADEAIEHFWGCPKKAKRPSQ